ncbi:hypothetical protein KY290_013848 [Solanum tuberosum]|uniref:Uncharacterized protein n=1 Tax=Solanum tuberosum TaxID=4113 RepID=A0ABQ7VMX3_SOLTU|nr:hypothetical protein KY289_013958 [Solanum tuberosum]KAH0769867.1 hypothetical protein KY290_013848 [Solanum tuberosum]
MRVESEIPPGRVAKIEIVCNRFAIIYTPMHTPNFKWKNPDLMVGTGPLFQEYGKPDGNILLHSSLDKNHCASSKVLKLVSRQWINNPDSQANATVFLAKFYGRAGLLNLINAAPDHLRPGN